MKASNIPERRAPRHAGSEIESEQRFRKVPLGPPRGADNKANMLVASKKALPSRSRHCLRRYLTFLQRVTAGECKIGHVRDEENPSDFMTKYVKKDKFEKSLEYATNTLNRVEPKRAKVRGEA